MPFRPFVRLDGEGAVGIDNHPINQSPDRQVVFYQRHSDHFFLQVDGEEYEITYVYPSLAQPPLAEHRARG